jgi:hypothetical protein
MPALGVMVENLPAPDRVEVDTILKKGLKKSLYREKQELIPILKLLGHGQGGLFDVGGVLGGSLQEGDGWRSAVLKP